jgi:enamine deaminase RidA (YjgF/YER057c/UK114 family)
VDGPQARELFFRCEPPTDAREAGPQAVSIYRAILALLEAEGGSFESVVSETLFLRNMRSNLVPIREARHQALSEGDEPTPRLATIEIEQPPLNERSCLEVAVHAIIPNLSMLLADTLVVRPACACSECALSEGLRIQLGDEIQLRAGGLCGAGEGAYEETLAMFGVAESLLHQAGMDFRDVARTWIHLREIDRDYGDLNRARREFFEARGIDPVPASTGIGGGPVSDEHDLCLGFYAVKAGQPPLRTVMTAPTLNEAPQYGADFVRGICMQETNKVALHVSGTASIDEAGKTAHTGDFEAQTDRMLVNIAALLEGQGASFGDVVSAVTYLKNPADAGRLREKLGEAGFWGFPNVLVAAPICRPDLLCETEAFAVLDKPPPLTGGR